MNILAFLFCLMLLPSSSRACMPHPNLVLCWETQEGRGTQTREDSASGLTGTLTAGPAWVAASEPQYFGNTTATSTAVNMGINTVSFSGTESVVTAITPILDFSGNKPYVVAFSFQPASLPLDQNRTIVSFTGVGATGWGCYMDTTGQLIWTHVGVTNSSSFNFLITDTNPHRVLAARNGGTVNLYVDGKPYFTQALADLNTGVSETFGIAQAIISAAGTWNGKAGNVAIYNFFPGPNKSQTDAFAFDEWYYYFGSKATKSARRQ